MRRGQDWGRLATYVTARRNEPEIGYHTLVEFAEATGISDRTLGRLERGQGVGRNTLSIVERTLGWAPGSCLAILGGGEPTGRGQQRPDSRIASPDPRTASPEELAEALEDLREHLIEEHGRERGLDLFAEDYQRLLSIRARERHKRAAQTSADRTESHLIGPNE